MSNSAEKTFSHPFSWIQNEANVVVEKNDNKKTEELHEGPPTGLNHKKGVITKEVVLLWKLLTNPKTKAS